MLARIGERLGVIFRASAPDPFVIAVLLTLATLGLALALTDHTAWELVAMWAGADPGGGTGGDGVWGLLRFAMQMCLILVTGYALAESPPVSFLMVRLASLPRSGPEAAALIALVAGALALVNWGLGLIGGALLARAMGVAMERRGIVAHYPLLAASGYVGLLLWHGGLSGSAPLTVSNAADLGAFLRASPGLLDGAIPLRETLFSPLNGAVTLGLLLIAPLVMALLSPLPASSRPASHYLPPMTPTTPTTPTPPTGRVGMIRGADERGRLPRFLEETPIVNLALAALIAGWAWPFYFGGSPGGGQGRLSGAGLDSVNLTMLMLALVCQGTPRRFLGAVEEGARACAGIIIQFPLYAGIMAVMSLSGLAASLSHSLASTTGPRALTLLTFVSASILNLFIPSGGGQWAIQGPIALEAARESGADPARVVMAIAYGDELTNMLQPFWALPLLAITGARARDIVGYTAVLMVIAGVWIGVCLLLL